MAHRYKFPVHPVADPRAIVGGSDCKYRFTLLGECLLRYEWALDGVFEDRASTFAINRHLPVPKFRVVEADDSLEIVTDSIHLHYDKGPFSASGLTVDITGKFSRHGAEWRYGNSYHDLGGTARTLDDVNGRILLGGGVVSKEGFATIDDSGSMLFDGNGWIASRRSGVNRVDGYLFAFGNEYRAAIKAFYNISGNQPLLPRWSLGNWWSRYHPYSAGEYLELMDRFRLEGLPFSVGILDMDWHLVHEARVKGSGWTGYTWNRKLFPNPVGFLQEMRDRKLKVALNDHPAGGVRSFEHPYQDMAKALGRDPSNKDPIPFDITNRKFCDAFFDVLHRGLENQGVDFWWIDWQQGSYSRTPGVDPLWMLNHYCYLDNGLHNTRPLTFSRFAGPGSHRYPIGFSGDTHITWESLDFQPEFTATASNIGYGWWSHDIGGHMLGHRDEELSTRWYQLGVFSPIMRLHSTDNPFITKEPWTFATEVHGIMDLLLRLRHRLLPYLYSMNVRSSRESEPIIQPLYWHHPSIDAAYRYNNEYFFGSQLLVIPITSPSDSITRLGRVKGWIPPKRHVDIFTGMIYDGDRELWLYRPLSKYPVLAREGAIIPLDGAKIPENGSPNPDAFEIIIVVGADGAFEIHEDDGLGANLYEAKIVSTSITFTQSTGTIRIRQPPLASAMSPTNRDWVVKLLACRTQKAEIFSGGEMHDLVMAGDLETGSTVLNLGPISSKSEVVVRIGDDPKLNQADFKKNVYEVIKGAYVDFELKRTIWNIITEDVPFGVKMGQLSALKMETTMLNAILEHLVADSRS